MQILGNMMSCGNKIIIKCNEGYRSISENDKISSECLNTGHWSSEETILCSKALNCKNRFDDGDTTNGVKTIYPDDITPVKALCVNDVDGGGWTVIQKRESASDFYKGWNEYRDGFGDDTNFWLGLDNIHRLTAQGNYTLRIDMKRMGNVHATVKYQNFSVGNEFTKYRLSVGGYSSDPAFVNPGDSLIGFHNGMQFGTKDNENGFYQEYNCAIRYKGAWWYRECHESNLNGDYGNTNYGEGLNWKNWTGYYESLISTRMMIRPN